MLDRLADALFSAGEHDPAAVLHESLTQELIVDADGARLRLALPFVEKTEISLKKVGMELIVGVGGQRRTIMLPPSMVNLKPSGARFEQGSLEVIFADTP